MIFSAVLTGVVLLAYLVFSPARQVPIDRLPLIATGQAGGGYQRFAETIAEMTELELDTRQTAGSIENITLLADREVDYAIIQSDIARYSYLGLRGKQRFGRLALVMPLFAEAVQVIVAADSDIEVLSDLRGRHVCVGTQGSGTYFNSLDVLQAAGLVESIDFTPIYLATLACLRGLDRGEQIDAVFATSNTQYARRSDGLRQLFFSESALQSLTTQYPYYRIERMGIGNGEVRPQLVVDALLVTSTLQPSNDVYVLVGALIRHWDELERRTNGHIDLRRHPAGQVIPYHAGADSALVSSGVRHRSYLVWLFVGGWLLLLVLSIESERAKSSYNRLGENPLSELSYGFFVRFMGKISPAIIGLTMLIGFIIAAVQILNLADDYFARRAGIVSPFMTMDFLDSIMWLVTYIASGFTADNIYPVSVIGKLIVAVLAIVGLVAPITLVIYAVNGLNKKARRQLEGFGSTDLKGHVVLCGWNEKVPGLIYTITGKDVSRRRKVVLVAEMDEQSPLEKYKFDTRYVAFCRGDGSDSAALRRASAARAEVFIVFADFAGSRTHNRNSILTILNIRQLNEQAHICAEIEYQDNIDHFRTSGCDALVYPALVISRLAATTILDPMILDYVLDVLTYHPYDELYSQPVRACPALEEAVGRPIRDIEKRLIENGVNPVGIVRSIKQETLFDAAFADGDGTDALLDVSDSSRPLAAEDVLIYSAERRGIRLEETAQPGAFRALEDVEFAIRYPQCLRLLVCADSDTLDQLREGLGTIIPDLDFTGIDIEKQSLRYLNEIDELAPGEYDRIVILTAQNRRSDAMNFEDLNEIDTELILTTKLFDQAFRRRGLDPQIITEIGNIENKELAKNGGADFVLPAILATERFLTKQACDHGHVSDFLMAAMNLSDGVHLHSHTVAEGDGFCGHSYADILYSQIDGIRIMGWLPKSEREELANKQKDFDFHFRTVVDKRAKERTAGIGDVIVMMIERRDRYVAVGDG